MVSYAHFYHALLPSTSICELYLRGMALPRDIANTSPAESPFPSDHVNALLRAAAPPLLAVNCHVTLQNSGNKRLQGSPIELSTTISSQVSNAIALSSPSAARAGSAKVRKRRSRVSMKARQEACYAMVAEFRELVHKSTGFILPPPGPPQKMAATADVRRLNPAPILTGVEMGMLETTLPLPAPNPIPAMQRYQAHLPEVSTSNAPTFGQANVSESLSLHTAHNCSRIISNGLAISSSSSVPADDLDSQIYAHSDAICLIKGHWETPPAIDKT